MQVMRIDADAVGVWEIETFADSPYRLTIPADGRASVTELGGVALEVDGEPMELLAWGRFDLVSGLAAGVVVGESLLLVLANPRPDGDFVAKVTPVVVHILEDHGLPPAR
jgi:hypothetical protein